MPKNQYGGRCYRCGTWCPAGAGHFERHNGGWRVQHAQCAIQYRGTDHTYLNPHVPGKNEVAGRYDDLPEVTCPYCKGPAQFVFGDFLYPHRSDLHRKRFWVCTGCDAHVGCHDRNNRPRGPLANAELRRARMRAHATFDPIWKDKHMRRGEAYAWLAKMLGMTTDECHISQFGLENCQRVVDVSTVFRAQLEQPHAAT